MCSNMLRYDDICKDHVRKNFRPMISGTCGIELQIFIINSRHSDYFYIDIIELNQMLWFECPF